MSKSFCYTDTVLRLSFCRVCHGTLEQKRPRKAPSLFFDGRIMQPQSAKINMNRIALKCYFSP
ncbi:Uncharacterised protein [Vibrio cholerae]|nr:Uncharacterised protein [Vibrio cholerae]CSC09870.1 Uncharacterised protein [Vibrio cholerae]